jgi:hypothetical protein
VGVIGLAVLALAPGALADGVGVLLTLLTAAALIAATGAVAAHRHDPRAPPGVRGRGRPVTL